MRNRPPTGTIQTMQTMPEPPERCPACGWFVPGPAQSGARCAHCGLPLAEPVAAELRDIAAALAAVDAERHRLWTRRAQLLAQTRPFGQTGPFAPAAPQWRPRRPGGETNAPAVQNVLLSLGGVLLAVAAVVFTVISWGSLGIGGRATVLALLTLAAMAVPATLVRRALGATAEVVACVGLVLLLLDSYAVRRTLLPDPDGVRYAAASLAVVSAVWAGYAAIMRPRAGRGLVLPAPAALVLAQLPLPLWSFADRSAYGAAAALLGTAVFDTAVAVVLGRSGVRGPRLTAGIAGSVTGALGLLTAGVLSAEADGPGAALRAGALLLGAAACALAAAYRMPGASGPVREAAKAARAEDTGVAGPDRARPTAHPAPGADTAGHRTARTAARALGAVAGFAAVAAAGGVLRVSVADGWAVPGYLACAVGLLGGSALLWRTAARPAVQGLAASAAAVHAMAVCWALVPLCVAMFGPLGWAGSVWTGAPHGARAAITPGSYGGGAVTSSAMAAVVVAAVVAAVLAAVADFRTAWADRALGSALGLAALAVSGLTVAAELPYAVAVLLRVVLAGLLLGTAGVLRARAVPARTAFGAALTVAVTTAGWALAQRALTLIVLALLLGAFTAVAVSRDAARAEDHADARTGSRAVPLDQRAAAGAAAVAWAAGLAWAGPAAAGRPAHHAAYTVLAVAAAALFLGARTSGARARAVEYAGCAGAALAVVLAAGDAPSLAAVLGLAGVLAAATALRADRRPAAGYAATALMVAASWVRLGASGVTVPEAYTLPVTAAALAVGWLRRRRDPAVSSWAAYGAGLAATLLPSLVAAWGDAHWPRPLLLGGGALAVTLLGARHRLRAPLLLGGAVLVLDAVHELAPFVLQVMGALPRWLPVALAGAALLAVGATYERRLRDVRRVRDVVQRMR